MSREELSRLVDAAEHGDSYRDLTESDRAMLDTLASFTGLRASEQASFTEKNFDFRNEPPTLTLEAAYSKRRREDVLPIHPKLADVCPNCPIDPALFAVMAEAP